MKIENVFLTNEFLPDSEKNNINANTDVIVQLKSGKKYIASFISYQNIESIRRENLKSGDFMNGKYFWKKQMLLIEDCEKNTIEEVVKHLMEEGDFDLVFQKLED